MGKEDSKLRLGPTSCGALAALFSTITNSEIRSAFMEGEYLKCLEYVLLFAFVAYFLFTIGYVVLNVWLGNATWFEKAKKFRKPVLIICALVIYVVTLYITILIFN